MNPDSFFREVLESHEFRLCLTVICETTHVLEYIIFMSDKANLLDMTAGDKARRFWRFLMVESAVMT